MSLPALNVPFPSLIVPLPVYKFPNKLAPKVPNSIPRNPFFLFYSFILIVLLTPFINKLDSSSDLTIFIISFIFPYEIIHVVWHKTKCKQREAKSEGQKHDPNIFLGITASVADPAAVNRNGILCWLNGLMV